MEFEGGIKPWGIFLRDIANEVTDEELKTIKLIIGDKLTARERDRIHDPGDLLELLEDKGLIGEDKTDLLRELFEKAEYDVLIPTLEEFEDRRKKYVERVSLLAGRRDPLFVGRDLYIREILDFFRESRHQGVRCICLWGMAGTGKTKLGAETCAIYAELMTPPPNVVLVDLNKKSSIEEVGMAMLSAVGRPVAVDKYDSVMVWQWMRTCVTEHVLLFDNADDLLKPTSVTKDHFTNMLTQSLRHPNHNVKIIITSRYAVDFQHLEKNPNFREMEVKPLEMHEAVKLLTKSVEQGHEGRLQVKGQQLISEEEAIELAGHCGNNPQALRAVASQLRSGKKPETVMRLLGNPSKMELVLNDQSLWGLGQDATMESAEGSRQVLQCLGVMFEDMSPMLKPYLVRLAVLPGLFSKSWGLTILSDIDADDDDEEALDELEFHLDDVAKTSLLVRESLDIFQTETGRRRRGSDAFYSMHPLVRCLCLMRVERDAAMKRAFQAALLAFTQKCFQLLKEFTRYDNEDASGSLQRVEREKINITQYLELEMRKTTEGKPHPLAKYLPEYGDMIRRSNISGDVNILAFMERFMFTKERMNFFERRAEAAKRAGDTAGWINHTGWYADQQLQLHRFNDAEESVKKPIEYCERLPQGTMPADLKEGYCQCIYVQGNILVEKPQDRRHIQIQRQKEGIQLLQRCIAMRRGYLNESIVMARSVNALGSCFFRMQNFEEALEKHREALQVMERVTQGHPEIHPDSTFYLMNVGTCYHEMGNKKSVSMG